jgi:hypothetical protein
MNHRRKKNLNERTLEEAIVEIAGEPNNGQGFDREKPEQDFNPSEPASHLPHQHAQ